jgi:hypothetical protein
MAYGSVRAWLLIEGLAGLTFTVWLYSRFGSSWLLFALLFLAPDLSLAAYLAGPRAGANVYNLVHSYSLAGRTAPVLVPIVLIWTAHISFDRMIGFGFDYPARTGETHLGRIGRVQTHLADGSDGTSQ